MAGVSGIPSLESEVEKTVAKSVVPVRGTVADYMMRIYRSEDPTIYRLSDLYSPQSTA